MSKNFESFGGSTPDDKKPKKQFSIAEKKVEEEETKPKFKKVENKLPTEHVVAVNKPQGSKEEFGNVRDDALKSEFNKNIPKEIPKKKKKKESKKTFKKEKKSAEKQIKEDDKDLFFNDVFVFESQRKIKVSDLSKLSKQLNLWSQNGPVFKRMEDLINKSDRSDKDKEKHLNEFYELKQYFQENALKTDFNRKTKDNPLSKGLAENFYKLQDKEEFSNKVRDLVYLYDRYQKPVLIEELKNIPKEDLKFQRKPSKKKDKKQFKEINLAPHRDFLVKAFPFLTLADQAYVYNLLVTDKEKVVKKVNVPAKYDKSKLSPGKRLKKLTKFKYDIIDDFVHFPIKDVTDLHEVELEKLRPLINHMVIIRARNKGPEYDRLRQIQKVVNKENRKNKEKKFKPELCKRILSQVDSVTDRFTNLHKRLENHPEIQGKSLEVLQSFVANFDLKKNPILYKLLVEKISNPQKYLMKFPTKKLQRVSGQLSTFKNLIKEANKFINKFLERAKAERVMREEIMERVPDVDLRALRKMWQDLGLDPTNISIKFSQDNFLPNVALKMQKRVEEVLAEELPEQGFETLKDLTFKLDFYNIYYKLDRKRIFSELAENEREQLSDLIDVVESDASWKEKKQAYKELQKISNKALDIAAEELKEELVAFITEKKLEEAQSLFEKLVDSNDCLEKFEIYQNMKSLE